MNEQTDNKGRPGRGMGWRNVLALVMLVGAFGASAVQVGLLTLRETTDRLAGRTVVRLAHSVADRHVQAALERAARAYEALHPDVRVAVQSIPQRAYMQWVTTQFLGETAPDLIQALSSWGLWAHMATRYMTPLGAAINQPNPYNRGTDLQGEAWRDTYLDGMRSGYWPHLTEFFSVPITIETSRVFYNKGLFRAATGSAEPPGDLREWFETCEQLKRYAAREKVRLFPIAGSRELVQSLVNRYYYIMGNGLGDAVDPCYWSGRLFESTLYGLYTKSWTFRHPRIKAAFETVRRLGGYCQPGFISNDHAQSRFLFLQSKGAMILGSARDAAVYMNMADFEVGVFDYPLPAADDPRFAGMALAPMSEASVGTVHFCVSRTSEHPEAALDFMMFLTSQRQNERFNQDVGWYPAIRGAAPRPELAGFAPHADGVSGRVPPYVIGPDVRLWFDQQFPRYIDGQIPFDTFADGLERMWLTKGVSDFLRRDRLVSDVLIQAERKVADSKARMLFAEAGEIRAGEMIGERTAYQLSLEMLSLLEFGVSSRAYTWRHLQQGDYEFP